MLYRYPATDIASAPRAGWTRPGAGRLGGCDGLAVSEPAAAAPPPHTTSAASTTATPWGRLRTHAQRRRGEVTSARAAARTSSARKVSNGSLIAFLQVRSQRRQTARDPFADHLLRTAHPPRDRRIGLIQHNPPQDGLALIGGQRTE